MIEDWGKKQIKAIGDHGKQMVEYNTLVKENFNIDRDSIPLEEKKKLMNLLLKKGLLTFGSYKKKLILIIWFICRKLKQEVQKILEIIKIWLKSLTDGNVRPREV